MKYYEFPVFSSYISPLNSPFPVIWVQKAEKIDEKRKNGEKGELYRWGLLFLTAFSPSPKKKLEYYNFALSVGFC